jgi:hypothetical protein
MRDHRAAGPAKGFCRLRCFGNEREKCGHVFRQDFTGHCQGPARPTFAKCVGGEHTADKWTSCAASANSDFARARNIATCVNPNKAACAAQYVGGDGAAFAACMAGGNDKLETYLAAANPALADAQKTFSCVAKSSDATQAFACLAPRLGGDASRIAGCVANPDKGAAAIVLARGQARSSRGPARLQMHREWKLRQQPHRKLLGRHS